jgi:hypothetical protein
MPHGLLGALGIEENQTLAEGEADPEDDGKMHHEKHRMRQRDPKHPSMARLGLVKLKDAPKFKTALAQCNVLYADELNPSKLQFIVEHPLFQRVILFSIVLNTLTLGISVDMPQDSATYDVLVALNNFFVYFFIFELLLRYIRDRMDLFLDSTAVFDLVLVSMGLLDIRLTQTGEQTDSTAGLRMATATRLYRLGELVGQADFGGEGGKIDKALEAGINEMKLFIRVISQMTKAWYSVGVLLFYVFFMYANFLTTEIGRDPELVSGMKAHFESKVYWGSLYNSMVTSFQVMTADGWTKNIHRSYTRHAQYECCNETPTYGFLTYFFLVLIVLCNYALMKVLVGTIVSYILQERKNDDACIQRDVKAQEGVKERFGEKVYRLLRRYFAGGARKLKLRDLDKMMRDYEMTGTLERYDINTFDIRNTVQQLPVVKDGLPDMEKMRAVLKKLFTLTGDAKSSEVFIIASKLRNCIRKVDVFIERVRILQNELEVIDERISPIDNGYNSELKRRSDAVIRMKDHIMADTSHNRLLATIERFRVREKTDKEHRFARERALREEKRRARMRSRERTRSREGQRSSGGVGGGGSRSRSRGRSRERGGTDDNMIKHAPPL